jgi:hypothetical protein
MQTSCFKFPENRASEKLGRFSALVGAVLLCFSVPPVRADIPDSSPARLGGIYKIASSNDPAFPVTKSREYFLDFGKGLQSGKLSGSVTVSVRVNPHVKARILSWEYFPDQGRLLIGRPFAHGSRNAVAAGAWEIKGFSNGVVFQRGTYQVVLNRAGPGDY